MFSRMAVYTVHLLPDTPLLRQKPVFVKEGFSIPAFLLPLFWALYQRMWLASLLLVAFEAGLMFLVRGGVVGPAGMLVLDLAMHVWVGFAANDWLRATLTRKGYLFSDVAVADTLLRAEQRYFDRCFAGQS